MSLKSGVGEAWLRMAERQDAWNEKAQDKEFRESLKMVADTCPPPRMRQRHIDITNYDSIGPEVVSFFEGLNGGREPDLVDHRKHRISPDIAFRMQLERDSQPEPTHVAPPRIVTWRDRDSIVWLRTFWQALHRELFGPRHLRRYLD